MSDDAFDDSPFHLIPSRTLLHLDPDGERDTYPRRSIVECRGSISPIPESLFMKLHDLRPGRSRRWLSRSHLNHGAFFVDNGIERDAASLDYCSP
jgi:hypothetical protein